MEPTRGYAFGYWKDEETLMILCMSGGSIYYSEWGPGLSPSNIVLGWKPDSLPILTSGHEIKEELEALEVELTDTGVWLI